MIYYTVRPQRHAKRLTDRSYAINDHRSMKQFQFEQLFMIFSAIE